MRASRYDAAGSEAEAEPGSKGRVLRNLLGIRLVREMAVVESQRLYQATQRLIDDTAQDQRFTAADLCRMHHLWLGDVYSWAGHFRSVNIVKGDFMFAAAEHAPDGFTGAGFAAEIHALSLRLHGRMRPRFGGCARGIDPDPSFLQGKRPLRPPAIDLDGAASRTAAIGLLGDGGAVQAAVYRGHPRFGVRRLSADDGNLQALDRAKSLNDFSASPCRGQWLLYPQ